MNRRTSLGLLGGSVLASTCGAAKPNSTAQETLSLDPNNPEDLHYMHRKLAYALDDRLTYWSIEALRMGFRDGVLTPFWNLHVGIVYKSETLDDFRYSNKAILKIFYTDLKTGDLLERFDNPYTGETVEAKQPGLFKTNRIFGLTGIETDTGEAPVYIKMTPLARLALLAMIFGSMPIQFCAQNRQTGKTVLFKSMTGRLIMATWQRSQTQSLRAQMRPIHSMISTRLIIAGLEWMMLKMCGPFLAVLAARAIRLRPCRQFGKSMWQKRIQNF